jgi:hypothetical protein
MNSHAKKRKNPCVSGLEKEFREKYAIKKEPRTRMGISTILDFRKMNIGGLRKVYQQVNSIVALMLPQAWSGR